MTKSTYDLAAPARLVDSWVDVARLHGYDVQVTLNDIPFSEESGVRCSEARLLLGQRCVLEVYAGAEYVRDRLGTVCISVSGCADEAAALARSLLASGARRRRRGDAQVCLALYRGCGAGATNWPEAMLDRAAARFGPAAHLADGPNELRHETAGGEVHAFVGPCLHPATGERELYVALASPSVRRGCVPGLASWRCESAAGRTSVQSVRRSFDRYAREADSVEAVRVAR